MEPGATDPLQAGAAAAVRDQRKAERHGRLRDEAEDTRVFAEALEEEGFDRREVLELITNWHGLRWNYGEDAP